MVMNSPIGRVLLVLSFMGFCITEALTGFVEKVIGREPWAVRALNDLLHTVFLSPLGAVGGTLVLVVLTAAMAVCAYLPRDYFKRRAA